MPFGLFVRRLERRVSEANEITRVYTGLVNSLQPSTHALRDLRDAARSRGLQTGSRSCSESYSAAVEISGHLAFLITPYRQPLLERIGQRRAQKMGACRCCEQVMESYGVKPASEGQHVRCYVLV